MKKVFVKTKNVKNFITMMNNLQQRADGVPGMGLLYGEPGLGKTQAVNWWAMKNDAIVVRCSNLMSVRWLLSEVVEELGEMPYYSTAESFKLIVQKLINDPRIIIFDEIDYLTSEHNVIETIRDIHDKTNVPVVLVGMAQANTRLIRYKHLYDRISEIVRFEPFTKPDLNQILKELAEVELTECAIKYIHSKTNRFRQIVKIINKAEMLAKANGLTTIDEVIIKEVIKDETTDREAVEATDKIEV